MSYIKIVENETDWRQFESRIQNNTLYNSWKWGEYKKKKGWDIVRAAVFDTKSLSTSFSNTFILSSK